MAKLTRNYSPKTLKVLFALSDNQCAHPDCDNPVIELSTNLSDAHVAAQICHIYAISDDGPRGKAGLTENERNAPENLILLCRHHHGIVDDQHESYPAKVLKEWKQNQQDKATRVLSGNLRTIDPDIVAHPYFPRELVDQRIALELGNLRKKRFFAEFDTAANAKMFGKQLVDGELSGTRSVIRSKALAWCARLLVRCSALDAAGDFLDVARQLSDCEEIIIADAFVLSQKGEKEASLRLLAKLDSASAMSAALMVTLHHEGGEGAITWFEKTGRDPASLDSDGKFILLVHQLKSSKWDAAERVSLTLTEEDYVNTPALRRQRALVCLLRAVPIEFRSIVTTQLPLDMANFPLASDASSMGAREEARNLFIEAASAEREFECHGIASLDDEYTLWLELRNPATADLGYKRLEEKLRAPRTALELVPFGLQFGVKLDLAAVEQAIEQDMALSGGITPKSAVARLTLALTQKSHNDVVNYIERHYEDLLKVINEFYLTGLQIEALSRAGMLDRAKLRLDDLIEKGLSLEDASRLRRMIAASSGPDPIALRKKQFDETNALSDLIVLVDEMELRGNSEELCYYAELLFQRTRSVADAERLAIAQTNNQKSALVLKFLDEFPEVREQSNKLQMSYCWALYNEGKLLEAQSELVKVEDDPRDSNYRILKVNLAIASGDWPSLTAYIASEYQAKDDRNAIELIQTAQLAHHLGSSLARNLTFEAAAKGSGDPRVLAAAYHLAATAGWEGDDVVGQWIHTAADLSGDQGPIQKMSLQDLVERKPDWDRRESDILGMLGRGDCPMFIAGKALNRTLADFMLFAALFNQTESDPRHRRLVPAYSGQRTNLDFKNGVTVGIDATALLTLSVLNLLDEALSAFDAVYIPHSTLFWLFEEKQKADFHQPSRIKEAHKFRSSMAKGALRSDVFLGHQDDSLSVQVDDELAILLTEAKQNKGELEPQKLVVRPSPVYKLGSLMDEEADLTQYAGVLSSCLSIAEKLREKGQITSEEVKKARAYLQLHEKPWPEQPEIHDGAVLYLDELAVAYFLHLGFLDKLSAAGFSPVVLQSKVHEFDALISYGDISETVNGAIERIRHALHEGIAAGRVAVGRQTSLEQQGGSEVANHPTVEVLALADQCDALLVDDRFINQNQEIKGKIGSSVVYSTADLINALVALGTISFEQAGEYRTLLRRACYFAVPIGEDELSSYLAECTITNNTVNETAELKAFRENLLCVRMSNWLQLPKESQWLHRTTNVLIKVLKSLWKQDTDLTTKKVLSNWLLGQIDVRGWAHRLEVEAADGLVSTGRGAFILLLFVPPFDVSEEAKKHYWGWLDESLLHDIEQQFPQLYEWIVDNQKHQVSSLVEKNLSVGGEV